MARLSVRLYRGYGAVSDVIVQHIMIWMHVQVYGSDLH